MPVCSTCAFFTNAIFCWRSTLLIYHTLVLIHPALMTSNKSSISNIRANHTFSGKQELVDSLQTFAISLHSSYRTVKSDTRRVSVECTHRSSQGCQWKLYASQIPDGRFEIKTLVEPHTCTGDANVTSPHATSQWVANRIEARLRNERSYNNKAIRGEIHQLFGVTISRDIAAAGRKLALNKIYGHIETAYQLLPQYARMIEKTNPGSLSEVVLDGNRFSGFFVSYGCHITGFAWCRPIIFLDGGFIKEEHGGQILAATTLDANGQLYPLAFAAVRSESEGSWHFLLNNLRQQLQDHDTDNDNLVFMSDRAKGLINAVEDVFPDAEHGYCLRHLYQNFFNRFKTLAQSSPEDFSIKNEFYRTANALDDNSYQNCMNCLDKEIPGARDYLESIGKQHWAAVSFAGSRYGYSNSNPAESINAWLVHERELPLIEMMEEIRRKLTKWMFDRRECSLLVRPPRLADKAEKLIEGNIQKARMLEVRASDENTYEVLDRQAGNDRRQNFVVHTQQKECSCKKWQSNQIPCQHAASVIMQHKNSDPREWASEYYTALYWKNAYSQNIIPLPASEDWDPFDHADEDDVLVLPPIKKSKRGRPKKRRIPSMCEDHSQQGVKKRRCGYCGDYTTHNKRACPQKLVGRNTFSTTTEQINQAIHTLQSNALSQVDSCNHLKETQSSPCDDTDSSTAAQQEIVIHELSQTNRTDARASRSRMTVSQPRGRIGTSWGAIVSHEVIEEQRWYWVKWDTVELGSDNPTRHLHAEFRAAGEDRWTKRYCDHIRIEHDVVTG